MQQQIYSSRDLAEAHFVKGLLDMEEIPATVQGGPLQAVLGESSSTAESLPSVWVDEENVGRAMEIITEMKQGGPAATESTKTWTCPKCAEVMEGQFSSCWQCGTSRPEPTPTV
ncbi:MAG: DUF2007 domain-containing protein [Tepidisphaeraceae bacterium]|jgi:hypothetical protein